MAEPKGPGRHISRPSVDSFVFEGEATPLLLRGRVVAGIVVAFIMLVATYLVLVRAFGWSFDVNAEPFRVWVDGWGAWGPVVFIGVMALSVLVAPIPNVPIFIAAGLVWGPVVGTTYSMAGLLIGSAMAFGISRRFGRKHLPRLIGKKAAERLDTISETMGGRVVFWARILPVVSFDWVSFVAGMTSIPFTRFFLYSALGMLFPTWVAVAAGDGLGRDIRITLAYGGVWVSLIVGTAAYFWFRRRVAIKRRGSESGERIG